MKKYAIISLLLALILVFSACGKKNQKKYLTDADLTINNMNIANGLGAAKASDSLETDDGTKTTYLSYDGVMQTIIDNNKSLRNNYVISSDTVEGPFGVKIGDSKDDVRGIFISDIDQTVTYSGDSSPFYVCHYKDENGFKYASIGGMKGDDITLELYKQDANSKSVKSATVIFAIENGKVSYITIDTVQHK
jgi:hypothetical protein